MCVGVPGRIVSIEGSLATVDFWGEQKQVMLDLLDAPPALGEWVLAHLGFAVRVIPQDDVAPTLELYESLLGVVVEDDSPVAGIDAPDRSG